MSRALVATPPFALVRVACVAAGAVKAKKPLLV